MFYNQKKLFFIILYAMSFALYAIADALLVKNFVNNYLSGPLILFVAIIVISFLAALVISLLAVLCYLIICKALGKERKKIFWKYCWILFTILSYLIILILFFEIAHY
jgi:hypothetical protein